MKKLFLLFLLVLVNGFHLTAQSDTLIKTMSSDYVLLDSIQADTLQDTLERDIRVMIIPFNQDFYFSDSDHKYTENTQLQRSNVVGAFRNGIIRAMKSKINSMEGYQAQNLFEFAEGERDLYHIYRGVDYRYDKPYQAQIVEDRGSQNGFAQRLHRWREKRNGQNSGDEWVNMGALKPGEFESRYMNVEIHHPEMLEYLHEKYESEIFVFINQFEIKSNYVTCLDRGTSNFERELIVHFSIFTKEGKQMYGNSVTLKVDSNSTDIYEIIGSDFPLLSSFMVQQLPEVRRTYN